MIVASRAWLFARRPARARILRSGGRGVAEKRLVSEDRKENGKSARGWKLRFFFLHSLFRSFALSLSPPPRRPSSLVFSLSSLSLLPPPVPRPPPPLPLPFSPPNLAPYALRNCTEGDRERKRKVKWILSPNSSSPLPCHTRERRAAAPPPTPGPRRGSPGSRPCSPCS